MRSQGYARSNVGLEAHHFYKDAIVKRIKEYIDGKPVYETVTWGGHSAFCEKCRGVDLENSATFINACAEGSPLLMEKLVALQAPFEAEKKRRVLEWAKKAGVFKIK